MANELSCYEQAARKAAERGVVPALCPKVFADTAGVPPDPLAPALVQDGDPLALSMSGADFYRAACVEAHARLLNLP